MPHTPVLVFAVVSCFLLSACATQGIPVTGQPGDPTFPAPQSETVITVSSLNGTSLVVAAYNDDTGVDKTIQYTDTSRTVLAGASLMGWSTSSNLGQSWTYRGKIRPN